jgi:hypothetical protein
LGIGTLLKNKNEIGESLQVLKKSAAKKIGGKKKIIF